MYLRGALEQTARNCVNTCPKTAIIIARELTSAILQIFIVHLKREKTFEKHYSFPMDNFIYIMAILSPY